MPEGGYDPAGFIGEVDDHAKPAARPPLLAVVALTAWHDGSLESCHFRVLVPDVSPCSSRKTTVRPPGSMALALIPFSSRFGAKTAPSKNSEAGRPTGFACEPPALWR